MGTAERGASPGALGRLIARWAALPSATAIEVLVGALCVTGLVMVGSASPVVSMELDGSWWYILSREVLWMVVGVTAFLVARRIDHRRWRAWRVLIVLASFGMLVAVLVPGVGLAAGGSSRWLGVGMLRVQPSEVMKFAMVLYAADLLTRRESEMREPRRVIVPMLVVLGLACALIIKQPDMGTALVLCCVALGMLFVAGAPMKRLMQVLGALAVVALIVGMAEPYRRSRLLSFIHPSAKSSGSGFQVLQSLIGLGTGGTTGLGLGGGHEKWAVLPNAHTDFIYSVVGEELGVIGAVVVLLLFVALAWYGYRVSARARDRFSGLMAAGITTWLIAQAVINIGAVIGLLPVTGIPLPFVSFGGTSLVINLLAAGVLVNVASEERGARLAVVRTSARAR